MPSGTPRPWRALAGATCLAGASLPAGLLLQGGAWPWGVAMLAIGLFAVAALRRSGSTDVTSLAVASRGPDWHLGRAGQGWRAARLVGAWRGPAWLTLRLDGAGLEQAENLVIWRHGMAPGAWRRLCAAASAALARPASGRAT
ncbi:hypothetical protein ISE1_1236 [plant metagenome]|uniref:Uncharacterized protein n=2 Tax=plant metagenome TaxID=1297885 RepID=A0A484TW09_9ZZZZ